MPPNSAVASNDWLQLAVTFISVLAILAILFFLSKRFSLKSVSRPEKLMSVVEMLPIDSRQRLVLLKVRDKEILLGITQHGIESLGEWPSDARSASPNTTTAAAPTMSGAALKTSGFNNLIRAATQAKGVNR